MAADGAEEESDGKGHKPFMVGHARVRSGAFTVQLVPGSNTSVQFFSFQDNNSTDRKILQADLKLSSHCDNRWTSHNLSAMGGLT